MKKLILILFLFSPVEAQTFKFLPLKHDAPDTEQGDLFKYDKADHSFGAMVLSLCIPTKKYNLDFWLPVGFGFLFEIKDGFQWKRSYGFSIVDNLAHIVGSGIGILIKDLCHEFGVYVLINKNGISVHF